MQVLVEPHLRRWIPLLLDLKGHTASVHTECIIPRGSHDDSITEIIANRHVCIHVICSFSTAPSAHQQPAMHLQPAFLLYLPSRGQPVRKLRHGSPFQVHSASFSPRQGKMHADQLTHLFITSCHSRTSIKHTCCKEIKSVHNKQLFTKGHIQRWFF